MTDSSTPSRGPAAAARSRAHPSPAAAATAAAAARGGGGGTTNSPAARRQTSGAPSLAANYPGLHELVEERIFPFMQQVVGFLGIG